MDADEIPNRIVVICHKDDSIHKAAERMRNNHVDDVIVAKHKGHKYLPIGILADRDVISRVLDNKVNLNDIAVKYVINNELLTVNVDDIIIETLEKMRAKGIRRVPVVNQEGGLEGILLEGYLDVENENELVSEVLSDLARLFKQKFNRNIKLH